MSFLRQIISLMGFVSARAAWSWVALVGVTTLLSTKDQFVGATPRGSRSSRNAGRAFMPAFVPVGGTTLSSGARHIGRPQQHVDVPGAQEAQWGSRASSRRSRMRLTMQSKDYYEILGISRSATKPVRSYFRN